MINPAKAYTIDEYIEILRRRIWYIIIPFILIVAGASAYAFFAPRQYKASTLVLVSPQRIPEAFVQATVTSRVEERLQSIAQEVLSRTRLEQIIGELKLYQKEQKTLSREEIVALMQKDIKIELPTKRDEKGYFTISYIGHDPNVVTTVANRLASQFIEENLKIREHAGCGDDGVFRDRTGFGQKGNWMNWKRRLPSIRGASWASFPSRGNPISRSWSSFKISFRGLGKA